MKIISLNCNGFRAFCNRGDYEGSLLDSLSKYNPDIFLFQEIKCTDEVFDEWSKSYIEGYTPIASPNLFRSGYSGVGALIRNDIRFEYSTWTLLNNHNEYDTGRIQVFKFKEFALVNVYVLNSGSEKESLRKTWDQIFLTKLKELSEELPIIIMGDFNSTTDERDCYDFENYFDAYPGAYKFEIDALQSRNETLDLVDSFRELHPNDSKYSWFSYRSRNSSMYEKGWRLDYAFIERSLLPKLINSDILGTPKEFSDHSPILLEMDINL